MAYLVQPVALLTVQLHVVCKFAVAIKEAHSSVVGTYMQQINLHKVITCNNIHFCTFFIQVNVLDTSHD